MAKKQNLTVSGWGIWIEWAEIDTDLAKRVLEEGLTRDLLEELLLTGESESGITSDIDVCLDGSSIGIDVADARSGEAESEAAKTPGNEKWVIVVEQAMKGYFVNDQITGKFDPSKLVFSEIAFSVCGKDYRCYDISYDDDDLLRGDTYPKVYDVFVVSPSGGWEAIEVLSEFDDEAESED